MSLNTTMTNTKMNSVVRAVVAVATSVLAGAGAGAVLARNPLVVTYDGKVRPLR